MTGALLLVRRDEPLRYPARSREGIFLTTRGPAEPSDEERTEATGDAARTVVPGHAVSRIALFVFDCPDADALRRLLHELTGSVTSSIEEVLLINRDEQRWPAPVEAELAEISPVELRFHRNPRRYEYGAARKAAFEYALGRGFDHVIAMQGIGMHPTAVVPELVQSALAHPEALVVACRAAAPPVVPGLLDALADRAEDLLGSWLHERTLGVGLRDYLSTFRVYPVAALRHVPFQLNGDGRAFDTELLIQLRALGVPIQQVSSDVGWREWTRPFEGLRRVVNSALSTIGYRLHQLHFTRRGQYLIDHGVHYTLKLSSTGSHMQIVDAIRSQSRVLDLGCSQGLLARPLLEKKVEVTGVDAGPERDIAREVAAYYTRDLEEPLDLPLSRVFDYVVVADVIEHLENREQLLRGARRFLKEDGRLIISTGNVALWFYRLSLLAGRFEYGPRGILDRTHVHLYTRATFRREVERAGFHVLKERVTSLPFEVVFESTGRSPSVRRLARAYHWLSRLWPEMFAYQIILEAEIETLDEEAAGRPEPPSSPSQ